MPRQKRAVAPRKNHSSVQHVLKRQQKPRPCALGILLMNSAGAHRDLGVLIVQMLPPGNLVTCSMVCSGLRTLVDRHCNSTFAQDLMWWFGFENSMTAQTKGITVNWNDLRSQFTVERAVTSHTDKIMWLLNTNLAVNAVIKMRMQIMLPASSSHVHFLGESADVQKIRTRGTASADVLAWRVLSVEGSENGLLKVILGAVEFSHNNTKVGLTVAAPVVLTVDGVQRQRWNYRSLWVIRGVRKCMHCHQRWRAMQSFDVKQANHRVLCSHCLELLYARESQLSRRWRLRPIDLPREKVPRASFVNCYMGAPMVIYPQKPDRFVLKADVAARFKCADWTEFIRRNHALKRSKYAKPCDKFLFSSRWW